MPAKKGAGAEGSAGGGGGGRISAWKPTQAVPRDPPLLEACKTRRAADALKLAEEDGVDVNVADEQGFSALMWSSFNEKFEAVAARLADAGAKLNAVSTPGGTSALVFACERGHAATALMLVEKGAKLNLMGCSGKTALDYADEKGSCAARARAAPAAPLPSHRPPVPDSPRRSLRRPQGRGRRHPREGREDGPRDRASAGAEEVNVL